MTGFEVEEPILCSPFEEPILHGNIKNGERRTGRRPAG
jgi:hypothetical protein